MQLSLQDFTALVRLQAAAVSASSRQLVDVTVGGVLRALLEANASVGLWLQWLIVEVLSMTRAATSKGADLDSWVADFGLARLAATSAAGRVTFSRASSGFASVVPVSALVRTGVGDDAQVFSVSVDVTDPNWTGGGYRLAATELSVQAPVVAQAPGIAGNVLAGTIRLLSSAVPGVDAVTNDGPMLGGLDGESDDALRARFTGFMDSRTRATAQAVGFAISSLRQNISFTIAERVDTAGAVRPGHFTVTVDDGTGAPSAPLLAQVGSAIEAVRPVGGTFSVRPPLLVAATIEMHLTAPQSATGTVRAAVLSYVNSLPIGAWLVLSRLYQVAHDADPTVVNVSGVTINGAASDLVVPSHGLVRAAAVWVAA